MSRVLILFPPNSLKMRAGWALNIWAVWLSTQSPILPLLMFQNPRTQSLVGILHMSKSQMLSEKKKGGSCLPGVPFQRARGPAAAAVHSEVHLALWPLMYHLTGTVQVDLPPSTPSLKTEEEWPHLALCGLHQQRPAAPMRFEDSVFEL